MPLVSFFLWTFYFSTFDTPLFRDDFFGSGLSLKQYKSCAQLAMRDDKEICKAWFCLEKITSLRKLVQLIQSVESGWRGHTFLLLVPEQSDLVSIGGKHFKNEQLVGPWRNPLQYSTFLSLDQQWISIGFLDSRAVSIHSPSPIDWRSETVWQSSWAITINSSYSIYTDFTKIV